MTAAVGDPRRRTQRTFARCGRGMVVRQRPSAAAAAMVRHGRSECAHGFARAAVVRVAVEVNGFL